MSAPEKQRKALQLIFAFFLGLMVTAFIGIGVYTFYPPNFESFEVESSELQNQQQLIRDARTSEGLTQDQQAELERLGQEMQASNERMREHQEGWARTTSIVLILLATGVMGVSLIRADQLPVISNGLLLGGVFTMLYGTGWTLASGDSQLRFWVMAFALLITLALGYMRFVKERGAETSATADSASGTSEFATLSARVEALERRLQAVAEAIRGD